MESRQDNGSIRPEHGCRSWCRLRAKFPLLCLLMCKYILSLCFRGSSWYGDRWSHVTRVLFQTIRAEDWMGCQCNAYFGHSILHFRTLSSVFTGYLATFVHTLGGNALIVYNCVCSVPICSYCGFNFVPGINRTGMVILSTEYWTDFTGTCACFSLYNIQLSVRHSRSGCLTALTGTFLD